MGNTQQQRTIRPVKPSFQEDAKPHPNQIERKLTDNGRAVPKSGLPLLSTPDRNRTRLVPRGAVRGYSNPVPDCSVLKKKLMIAQIL